MIYELLDAHGGVINTIVADADFMAATYAEGTYRLAEAQPETQSPSLQVPVNVSMRQARLALHAVGLLDTVEDAIDALPEPNRTRARIEWNYATDVARHHGLVLQLAPALGLTEEQLDQLFISAKEIP